MYVYIFMTKIISLKDEAYHRLKKMKGDKSFTEIIMDLTEQHDLLDHAGYRAQHRQPVARPGRA